MIKNIVHDNAFIKCDISQFLLIINNCLAYFIIFVINLIYFEHFIKERVIDNINLELNIIEV